MRMRGGGGGGDDNDIYGFDGVAINVDSIPVLSSWERPPDPLAPVNDDSAPSYLSSLRRRGRELLSSANTATRAALSTAGSRIRSPPTTRRRIGSANRWVRIFLNITRPHQQQDGESADQQMVTETLELQRVEDDVFVSTRPPPLGAPEPHQLSTTNAVTLEGRVRKKLMGYHFKGTWRLSPEHPQEKFSYKSPRYGTSLLFGHDCSGTYQGSFLFNGEKVQDEFNLSAIVENSSGTNNVEGSGCNRFGQYKVSGILCYKVVENKLCTYLTLSREYVTQVGGTVVESNNEAVELNVESNNEAVELDNEADGRRVQGMKIVYEIVSISFNPNMLAYLPFLRSNTTSRFREESDESI